MAFSKKKPLLILKSPKTEHIYVLYREKNRIVVSLVEDEALTTVELAAFVSSCP